MASLSKERLEELRQSCIGAEDTEFLTVDEVWQLLQDLQASNRTTEILREGWNRDRDETRETIRTMTEGLCNRSNSLSAELDIARAKLHDTTQNMHEWIASHTTTERELKLVEAARTELLAKCEAKNEAIASLEQKLKVAEAVRNSTAQCYRSLRDENDRLISTLATHKPDLVHPDAGNVQNLKNFLTSHTEWWPACSGGASDIAIVAMHAMLEKIKCLKKERERDVTIFEQQNYELHRTRDSLSKLQEGEKQLREYLEQIQEWPHSTDGATPWGIAALVIRLCKAGLVHGRVREAYLQQLGGTVLAAMDRKDYAWARQLIYNFLSDERKVDPLTA